MEFQREEVAAKFEMLPEKDRKVTVPTLYSGPLSNITLEAAEKMLADGDNQLKLKPETTAKATVNLSKPIATKETVNTCSEKG